MGEAEVLFSIPIMGYSIDITLSIVIQWIVIAIVGVLAYLSTRNLNRIPDKKQSSLELFVGGVTKLIEENMGSDCRNFVPYIGTLIIFLLILNFIGLIGFEAPTEDYSVALGLAAISFFVIQAHAIKKQGILHYFIGYAKPIPFLLPINIMERVMLPVSLSLRLFGNMTAGAVIISLVYNGLGKAAIGIPVPLHFYFDVFDGAIQMVIFVMLTMINIKVISEH